MKITRIIAISVTLAAASPGLAQPLRDARPPTEFPPSSYTARQYVDGRGCIYIRAGIDGNVTWVPRVDRARRQVCGYQPSLSEAERAAAAGRARPADTGAVEIIELEPGEAVAPSSPVASAPQPAPAQSVPPQAAPPRSEPRQPSPGPAATVFTNEPDPAPSPVASAPANARPAPARVTTAPVRQPSPGPAPTVFTNTQPAPKVAQPRPAPAKPAPVRVTIAPNPVPQPEISADTRAVRRHIYENRQASVGFTVPKGYRPVWTDDRLNPKRGEMTLRPSAVTHGATVPSGYRAAWQDDRLNPKRGGRSTNGEAQTDRVWSQDLPRRLLVPEVQGRVVQNRDPAVKGNSPFWTPPVQAAPVAKVSTRSAPVVAAGRRGGNR